MYKKEPLVVVLVLIFIVLLIKAITTIDVEQLTTITNYVLIIASITLIFATINKYF